jgi:hypothetical protein
MLIWELLVGIIGDLLDDKAEKGPMSRTTAFFVTLVCMLIVGIPFGGLLLIMWLHVR